MFLHRVQRLQGTPNTGMREGCVLHEVVANMFIEAKRLIYLPGPACLASLERLSEQPLPEPQEGASVAAGREQLLARMEAPRRFEARRIIQRVEAVLASHPHAGPDALAVLALPASVEVKLNGRFLGMSEQLAADAIIFPEMLVLDLKFGPKETFHRLTTTGYALVLEALFEAPIDVGCIVYARFVAGHVVVERDFHVIGDELRQMFIEEHDEKMRLTAEELDPGLPSECPQSCPYLGTCHPIVGSVTLDGQNGHASANPHRRCRAQAALGS